MTIVPPFDPLVKKYSSQRHDQQLWPTHVAMFCNEDHCIRCHWCPWRDRWEICKDITSNFGQHMLQCFATMTITFTIINVHGEINGKFARVQPPISTNACCNLLQQ
jgi:hypothetical protein